MNLKLRKAKQNIVLHSTMCKPVTFKLITTSRKRFYSSGSTPQTLFRRLYSAGSISQALLRKLYFAGSTPQALFCRLILGCRDGAVVETLSSLQCGPSSMDPPRCHMWVEFAVGSRLAGRVVFSPGSPVFLPPQKPVPTLLNSSERRASPRGVPLQTPVYFILLFNLA